MDHGYKIRALFLAVKSNFASAFLWPHEAKVIRFKRWRSAPLWKKVHSIRRNSQCTKKQKLGKNTNLKIEAQNY
jgi:transposase